MRGCGAIAAAACICDECFGAAIEIMRNIARIIPLMPVGNYSYQFFICCPRDCVSQHNGGTSGSPLKPLRVDSALRALSTLRGFRGAPEAPPLCRETQSLGQQMLNAPFGISGLTVIIILTIT